MEIMPTFYSNAICPQIPQITDSKIFFHILTGGRKYALNEKEYEILMNPYDAQMVIFYQYLSYIIYRQKIPCTPYHFRYVGNMLTQIENQCKKQEQEKVKQLKINPKS